MNPYAGLNGLGAQNPAARLLQQPGAGMANGLTIQGSLPMDDMKSVWMQNQAGLVGKSNATPNLGAMGLGGGSTQQRMQLPGGGLPSLQQVANGSSQIGQGMRLDNATGLAGMTGLGGQNLQALQLQQLQQAQAQQHAAQQAQAQQLLQQQLQRQQQLQQVQAQAALQQQQQAQLAQLRQQQLQQQQLQQQLQQQQLLQQQQQMANAGLQGNAGLMQGNLQSLIGNNAGSSGSQFMLNQSASSAAAQLANNQRQAELLAANGLSQLQLQGGTAGQGLTAAQQQQLLHQQLLKQAAQQGVAASQGLQFGGGGVPQSTLLQQQMQANNAAQLRNLAQMNAAQDLVRRQQQAQLQAQQQQQALQLQQLQRQQQLQQMQAAQAAQAAVQQQSANQQAINAAAAMALRAGSGVNDREQFLRLVAAAAGKADTVGTLPSQLSTANATAALTQRQLVAGLNAQQKAAALQGLAAAAGNMQQGGNVAATQAMLSQLLATNRTFEPNPARVGVIGQDRGKQPSTDLGGGLQQPLSAPLQASTNPALSSLVGAVSTGLASLAPGNSGGPSRQVTPPPISSPGPLAGLSAASAVPGMPGDANAAVGGDAAAVMGSGVGGLPLTASPEHVEAFLKAVGKRFAAMGLTVEQALEFNILKGLTKEQLAVLSESQAAASAAPSTSTPDMNGAAAGLGASSLSAGILGESAGLPSGLTLGSEALPVGAGVGIGNQPTTPAATNAAGAAAASGAVQEDDDDKILESLLEPEEKPATSAVGQLDETTAAALLAMTQVDANFNAFTYGFFDDTSAGPSGLGDLLGELEPEGATTLEGDEVPGVNGIAVSDLSELADFEPVDPLHLASWGSIDTTAADHTAMAAALAAVGTHGAVGEGSEAVLAESALASAAVDSGEKPAGAESEVADVAGQTAAEALTSDLKGLSLGAGFE